MTNVASSSMAFSTTGTFFPGNGMGTARSIAAPRGTTTGATSTYGNDSVTDSGFNPTTAGVAVGDYVFTSDGYYQSVKSFVAGAGGTITMHGRWKLPPRDQVAASIGKPLGGTATATILAGSVHIGIYEKVIIDRINFASPGAGTVAIGDQKAVAIAGRTYDLAAADPSGNKEVGYEVDSPFCIIVATAATVGTVEYRALR